MTTSTMKPIYTYPQEVWSRAECAERARFRPKNAFGDRNPWPGLIASSSSVRPEYGQTVRYNGGTIIDGEHYQSVHRPLPSIHPDFHFVKRLTWGTYIEPVKK